MLLLNSKRGQIQNYLAVIIFLFGFAIITIIAALLMANIKTSFQSAGLYTGVLEETGDDFISALNLYDKIMVLVMVVLIIGVGLTSFRINTAPAFFIVTLIMGTFLGFVSYFFNYVFIQTVSQPVFTATIVAFPLTILICTNLHWVALVAMVVGSITLYAKKPATLDTLE